MQNFGFEKMEHPLEIINTSSNDLIEPLESVGFLMFRTMTKHKEKIAQIDAKSGVTDTFGALLSRSIRTALHMKDAGIRSDHVICICSGNHLNSCVPFIASQLLGAKIANIDISFSQEEIIYLLGIVRPKIIFVTPESEKGVEIAIKEICSNTKMVTFGKSQLYSNFEEFLKPHQNEKDFMPFHVENLKDTALIYFSSGTTGLPKGICISHYSFIGQRLNSRGSKNVDQEFLQSLRSGSCLLGSFIEGYCRLICDKFDGITIWNLMERYKISAILLTPVHVIDLLRHVPNPVHVNNVLSMMIMGSTISKKYITKLREIFSDTFILNPYGQTETSGPIAYFNIKNKHHRALMLKPSKSESIGIPIDGMQWKVVDVETQIAIGPNFQGELMVKSPFLMNGYWNADASECFDKDGWLRTGDIVYYDEDYCFYFVERIKEAFKYQGWFIIPTVLENLLLKHPAVKFAIVIGVPKEDGCHPKGLVVLNPGYEITEKQLETFVEEQVSERQRLREGVTFITEAELPLTPTGKVKRKQLLKLISKHNADYL